MRGLGGVLMRGLGGVLMRGLGGVLTPRRAGPAPSAACFPNGRGGGRCGVARRPAVDGVRRLRYDVPPTSKGRPRTVCVHGARGDPSKTLDPTIRLHCEGRAADRPTAEQGRDAKRRASGSPRGVRRHQLDMIWRGNCGRGPVAYAMSTLHTVLPQWGVIGPQAAATQAVENTPAALSFRCGRAPGNAVGQTNCGGPQSSVCWWRPHIRLRVRRAGAAAAPNRRDV